MIFTREQLEAKAKIRPDGYINDVLSRATVNGDLITLDDNIWRELRVKYHHAPAPEIVSPEQMELSKKRFEICKNCDQSTDQGFGCRLHKSCCFGRWRSNPKNKCYAIPPKWEAI